LLDTRDNQTYKTVTIGTQTWMAENLNYGTIANSFDIQSQSVAEEKYCYDDMSFNCGIYGGLYQWNEMMNYVSTEGTQGICPNGWHLPTDDEWKILEVELGMTQVQADAPELRGTDQGSQLAGIAALWSSGFVESNAAFGSSGFDALPAGALLTLGFFGNQSSTSFFWTSTVSGTQAWYRSISGIKVFREVINHEVGMSVRCVMD